MHVCKSKVGGILVLAIGLAALQTLQAQDNCSGVCKVNSNLGMVLNVPVNPTAQVTNIGWGATGGVGYNFTSRNSLIGEFLWNRMYPSGRVLQPLQMAISEPNSLKGNSNLYGFLGSYRYQMLGQRFGTYFIGGGGWYFRKNWLSQEVSAGSANVCTPAWLWWGFSCTSGTVTANQTLATSTTSAWGINGGGGFTVRVGEAPYRMYVEARYHYVPTKNIKTEFIALTIGIRY